jgi:hypothetical protein
LRASNMKYKKGLCATLALLALSWIGNAVLVMVIVNSSKELKVEGVSLKTMNGGSVSTHGQKNVFDVTLTVSGRRLDEQGSGNIQGHLQEPVAQVICKNVLRAISSIENGDDESLVKITVGDGIFWEPRMSAASYHLHENSFGIDQLYLLDQPAVFYDVNCEMSKEACETHPGHPCDVLPSAATASRARALSFEDAFDGDIFEGRRLTNRHFWTQKQQCRKERHECNLYWNRDYLCQSRFSSCLVQKADLRERCSSCSSRCFEDMGMLPDDPLWVAGRH